MPPHRLLQAGHHRPGQLLPGAGWLVQDWGPGGRGALWLHSGGGPHDGHGERKSAALCRTRTPSLLSASRSEALGPASTCTTLRPATPRTPSCTAPEDVRFGGAGANRRCGGRAASPHARKNQSEAVLSPPEPGPRTVFCVRFPWELNSVSLG